MDQIPSVVKQFLHAKIDSVDELEILRLLADDPHSEFSSNSLSKPLGLTIQDVEMHIKSLDSKGLLKITNSQPLTCISGARSSEMDSQLGLLIKVYQERPVSLIKMVYDKDRQLRLFSDAFRLKKEE